MTPLPSSLLPLSEQPPLPTPTAEQFAIIEAARTSSNNLLISALAGCAKTSTLVMLVRALPVQPTLCLAFNKRIATEMQAKMPGHCNCSTLNALGHRAWGAQVGARLSVSANKVADLLKSLIKEQSKEDASALWDNFAAIKRTLSSAKTQGVVPPWYEANNISGLIPFEEFMEYHADDECDLDPDWFANIISSLLTQSIEGAKDGSCDFDDQLYMPTLFGGQFPNYRLTLIDEAQDLSPLNHAMLRKIVRQRIIAVGDPNQSIYGFRGAVANGMDALRQQYNMVHLGLSVTFRCPQAIVRRAQSRVPHFRWAEGASEGEVFALHKNQAMTEAEYDLREDWWCVEGIPNGAAIICRNNAPLLSTALALIRAGRGVNLVGSNLGPQLIKTLKKLGPETMEQPDVLTAIDQWSTSRIKRRPSSEAATLDRADCLRVFADTGPTLGDAIAHAERVFAAEGPIQLLSGHKSKGLEWETVYHLDPWRIPAKYASSREAREQEFNLRYVIETRARQRLILVNAEDLT